MAVYVSEDVASDEEKQPAVEYYPLPIAANDQERYRFKRNEDLKPESYIDTRNGSCVRDFLTGTKIHHEKIRSDAFSFNNPWLPADVVKLLNKMGKKPITEAELLRLMKLVVERAAVHFQLPKGRFVAVTFHGRVVEVSNSRVDLLKKIQGRNYGEQIFVWRTGFKAFSGRI